LLPQSGDLLLTFLPLPSLPLQREEPKLRRRHIALKPRSAGCFCRRIVDALRFQRSAMKRSARFRKRLQLFLPWRQRFLVTLNGHLQLHDAVVRHLESVVPCGGVLRLMCRFEVLSLKLCYLGEPRLDRRLFPLQRP
jgi:hypothetical protein